MEQRRETDKITYKLTWLSGIIISIGIIGGAILGVAGVFFQTNTKAQACEQKLITQIQTVEAAQNEKIETVKKAQNESDKTIVEIRTDIKYIRSGIEELKRR